MGGRKECRIFQIPIEIHNEVYRIIQTNEKYKNCTITKIDATPNYTLLVPQLIKFLEDNWKEHIIVIEAERARDRLTRSRFLEDIGYPSESMCHRAYATKLLINSLNCWYIPLQSDLLCRDSLAVHYGFETFEYLGKMIGEIVYNSKNYRISTQRALVDYQFLMARTLNEGDDSLNKVLTKVNSCLKKQQFIEAIHICLDNINVSNSGLIEKKLVQIYLNKNNGERNLQEALNWVCKAI